MWRSVWMWAVAGCVAAPSLDGSDALDRFLAIAPGATLGSGCEEGALALSYSVSAHPLVARYEAVITADGTEVARIDLGFEGSGTRPLDAATSEACAQACLARLVPVDASGAEGVVLAEIPVGLDADGDGFSATECGGTDCADDDPAIHPEAVDGCDGVDDDCDGAVDDDVAPGDAPLADLQANVCAGSVQVCTAGTWVEPDYGQLADYGTDTCDGLDNDCNGVADDAPGAPPATLQDGVCAGAVQVCDGLGGWMDPDYAAYSAAYASTDDSCDGLDNDCNGIIDDALATIAPLADLQDGVCAGARKACDGSGGWMEPDYALYSADYAPTDDCDGLDNDCNGQLDDVDLLLAPDADLQDGVCAGQRKVCGSTGWEEPDYTQIADYEPSAEASCDGLDNDCDGTPDDLPASASPPADLQLGVCAGAVKTCDLGTWVEPDYALLPDYALIDACDGLDNDCDGTPDEVTPADAPLADLQEGVCAGSLRVCGGSAGWVEPDYLTSVAFYEAIEETCDDLDNDCDGVEDTVYALDPSTSTLECWGSWDRLAPDRVDDGPWKTVIAARVSWEYPEELACALDLQDHLWCWGHNVAGGLGDGTILSRREIREVSGGATWKHVAAGNASVCGIQSDDSLWCWGWDPLLYGPITMPERVGADTWIDVDVGASHRCGVKSDGSLWCWGYGDGGQLGDFAVSESADPVRIGTATWSSVSTGEDHSCALATDSSLWCWGINNQGELGVDAYLQGNYHVPEPVEVAAPGGRTWAEVSAGGTHTCARATDGTVWCWGDGDEAQLGDGLQQDSFDPVQVPGGPWDSVSVGGYHSCATASGALYCWGSNSEATLGTGDYEYQPSPVLIRSDLARVGTGSLNSCALSSLDDSLWCWGPLDNPATGPGPETPTAIATTGVLDVSIGDLHGCYLDATDGSAWCFGTNSSGEVGDGTLEYADVPVRVADGPFVDIAAGGNATMALDADGHRWVWGSDRNNQLGIALTGTIVPIMDGPQEWAHVEFGYRRGCGLAADQTVWCWGQGVSTYPSRLGPEIWDSMTTGGSTTCAIDGAGVLACWSSTNSFGQLGTGDLLPRDYVDREAVPGGPWRSVSAGTAFTCAVKPDDTLWCWGRNNHGQLGNGTLDGALSPVQVPGSWVDVRAGGSFTCATRSDQSLWCWGLNEQNELARDLQILESTTPVLVTQGTTVFDGGIWRSCAARSGFGSVTCP
ncbi:MAG: MopE-related protein [Myxococcota bacterium]